MNEFKDKTEWTVIFVLVFAEKHGLTMKQAFNYLSRYKGIDFVDQHYGYVHTQSFESIAILLKEQNSDISMNEALSTVFNSETYQRLLDTKTGFYYQSPRYVFSFLDAELKTGRLQ